MHRKFLATTLLAASLLAAPAIAYAQNDMNQKGQSASTETSSKASMKHHKMRTTHMKPGTTTGMSTGSRASKPTTRKPPAS